MALNIALSVAKNTNKTVAFFSLEMSREQLAMRLLSNESFVDNQKLVTGKLTDEDWNKLSLASSALSQTDIRVDKGFEKNEPVDVVIRPEDIDIVPPDEGHLCGTVTSVTFKGVHYDTIVDFKGFKWLIQTTDYCPVDSYIGIRLNPEDIHIMHKSEYSGLYGDYSSYSAEYDEIADAQEEAHQQKRRCKDEHSPYCHRHHCFRAIGKKVCNGLCQRERGGKCQN